MPEKEPIKSTREGVDPLSDIPKPLDNPDALTQRNVFIDLVLISQGATLTDVNRQNLRSKLESMQKHLN